MAEVKISRNTRPARAGAQMGAAIVENVHLLYLNDNALEYLQALAEAVTAELARRKAEAAG